MLKYLVVFGALVLVTRPTHAEPPAACVEYSSVVTGEHDMWFSRETAEDLAKTNASNKAHDVCRSVRPGQNCKSSFVRTKWDFGPLECRQGGSAGREFKCSVKTYVWCVCGSCD